MTGSAEPGQCGTTVRARAGHGLEPAARKAQGNGVHQRRMNNVPGRGRQVRAAGPGGIRFGSKLASQGARASWHVVDRRQMRRIGTPTRAHRTRLVAVLITDGGGG